MWYSSDHRAERGRRLCWLLLLAGLLTAAGCAAPPDSDIPWSTPQPWEGAPSIPGFNQL